MSTPRPKREGRRPGCYVVALLCLLGLVAVYAVPSWQVDKELARLRAAGALVDIQTLLPKVPPGERNAADLYQQAYQGLVSVKDLDGFPRYPSGAPPFYWNEAFSTWPADLQSKARELVTHNGAAYELTTQAAAMPACAFPIAWDDPLMDPQREGSRMRLLSRLVILHGRLAARDGKVREALEDCVSLVRMGNHVLQEPETLLQGSARLPYQNAVCVLEEALCRADPDPEQCRRLFDLLSRTDLTAAAVRARQGDLARAPAMFAALRNKQVPIEPFFKDWKPGDPPDYLLRAYPTVGRPMFDRDCTRGLRFLERAIKATAEPWPRNWRDLEAIEADEEALPRYHLVAVTVAAPPHITRTREEAAAKLRAAQIALALLCYKHDHGGYPADLATLEGAGWKTPADPFTGRPFVYRREGRGFIVYSLGPDGVDQGGQPYDSTSTTRARAYDLPFRCAR